MDETQNTEKKVWLHPVPAKGFTVPWLQTEKDRSTGLPRREVGDGSGLRIRFEPTGAASWIAFIVTGEDKTTGETIRRRIRIGGWPDMPPEAAADKLRELRKSTNRKGATIHATSPFGVLLDAFIAEELSARRREKKAKERGRESGPDVARVEREIRPLLGKRPIGLIGSGEIRAIIRDIVRRSGPSAAEKTLALISQAFRLAQEEDAVVSNPCDPINRKKLGTSRGEASGRHLALTEIAPFWNRISDKDAPLSEVAALAGKITLLTGCRPGEVREARWQYVDFEKATWRIPGKKEGEKAKTLLYRKTDEGHTYALSKLALGCFKRLKEIGRGSEWVCISPQSSASGYYEGESLARAFRNAFKGDHALKGGPFSPKTLRLTAKHLAEKSEPMGKDGRVEKVSWFECEQMVLGHQLPTRVAQHYATVPDPERHRAIAEATAALVERLIAEKAANVSRPDFGQGA
jgi:integrase